MAVFNGKSIKGSIGPVSFTQKGNVSIVRSKPGKGGVKQTAATKNKASLFGAVVSPMSRLLRQALAQIHQGFYDGAMVNRMNSAVATIINQHVKEGGAFSLHTDSFSRLNGFDFNSNAPFNKSLLLQPKAEFLNGILQITLPNFEVAKNLKFPVKANTCQIDFQLVLYSTQTGHWQVQKLISTQISKSQLLHDAQSWRFNIPTGCLAMIGCSLNYRLNPSQILVNDKSFHPSGILLAYYHEGETHIDFDEHWALFGVKMALG